MNHDSNDDDIPVLTDAVSRKRPLQLEQEQLDALCDSVAAETWVLLDRLLAEALRDTHEQLREQLNAELGQRLPQLIERSVRDKLGDLSGK